MSKAILKIATACAVAAFSALPMVVRAESLSVSPTSISVPAGGQNASLTVRSDGPGVIQGQVRIVRWTRSSGQDIYEATRDIVASPPAVNLAPNQEATIRLVRASNAPLQGKECYRVLVDQLPGSSQAGAVVQLTIRHSVPLCFG